MSLFDQGYFKRAYEQGNYKIYNYPENFGGKCYIYFSGNGLYDPDAEQPFKDIITRDRYEWMRWKAIAPAKEIYIRDIYKCWYYKGINSTISNVEKLKEFLKKLTDGFEGRVVTVGSSAGGYAAVLFGILLQAEKIFCFSAQFDIEQQLRNLDRINYNKNYVYATLTNLIKKSTVPIFYFYPCKSEMDITQCQYVKNIENVTIFPIKSKLHGKAIYPNNMPRLLSLDPKELNKFTIKFQKKKVHPFYISLYLIGLNQSFNGLLFNLMKPIYYKINDVKRLFHKYTDKNK